MKAVELFILKRREFLFFMSSPPHQQHYEALQAAIKLMEYFLSLPTILKCAREKKWRKKDFNKHMSK